MNMAALRDRLMKRWPVFDAVPFEDGDSVKVIGEHPRSHQSRPAPETCFGIFYRRKQAHLGAPKSTTATARKLACLIYHLLKYKQPYQKFDPAIYQLRLQKSALTKLQRQALALGYTLLPTTPPPA